MSRGDEHNPASWHEQQRRMMEDWYHRPGGPPPAGAKPWIALPDAVPALYEITYPLTGGEDLPPKAIYRYCAWGQRVTWRSGASQDSWGRYVAQPEGFANCTNSSGTISGLPSGHGITPSNRVSLAWVTGTPPYASDSNQFYVGGLTVLSTSDTSITVDTASGTHDRWSDVPSAVTVSVDDLLVLASQVDQPWNFTGDDLAPLFPRGFRVWAQDDGENLRIVTPLDRLVMFQLIGAVQMPDLSTATPDHYNRESCAYANAKALVYGQRDPADQTSLGGPIASDYVDNRSSDPESVTQTIWFPVWQQCQVYGDSATKGSQNATDSTTVNYQNGPAPFGPGDSVYCRWQPATYFPGSGSGTSSVAGRWECVERPRWMACWAILEAQLDAGGWASAQCYWNGAYHLLHVTAYDYLLATGASLPSGAKVKLEYFPADGKWWVTGAQCQ